MRSGSWPSASVLSAGVSLSTLMGVGHIGRLYPIFGRDIPIKCLCLCAFWVPNLVGVHGHLATPNFRQSHADVTFCRVQRMVASGLAFMPL